MEQGLPEPDFKEEFGVVTVQFYRDRWNEKNLKELGLNERQIKAVMYAKQKGSINISSFKSLVPDVSEKTLYRDLQELINKGILRELGEKKGRRYELL